MYIERVIGLPGKEDWPKESPIHYNPAWARRDVTTQLLPSLNAEENNLLNVSVPHSPI